MELCMSPPIMESSEPILDMDDVLEREKEGGEIMAGERTRCVYGRGGQKRARAKRVVYLSLRRFINAFRVHNASASVT